MDDMEAIYRSRAQTVYKFLLAQCRDPDLTEEYNAVHGAGWAAKTSVKEYAQSPADIQRLLMILEQHRSEYFIGRPGERPPRVAVRGGRLTSLRRASKRISTIPIDKVCFLRYDLGEIKISPFSTDFKEMEQVMIYADNAATTKTSPLAQKAMLDAMERVWGNPSSLHTPGQQAKEAMQSAREAVAKAIGAQPREIYFTSGGSEADNQAIASAARVGALKGRKHLITTAIEHHAVLHTVDQLAKEGFEVTVIPVDESGIVKVSDVAAAIRDDTALVSVMYANNEIGTIQPVAEIGALCRERGVPFHTDAVQAVGHLPIDVNAQNIDMLSLSAHKFHGPRGVGALYVRRGAPLLTFIQGGAQESGRRAGTENLPAIMGMAAALEDAVDHMEENNAHALRLRDGLIDGLSRIPHCALNGDRERRLPSNVNFCFEGIEGESLLLLLDDKGVAASSGSACTSGSLDPSHVLLAIGRPHEVAHGSLRLTLDHENTMEDVEAIVKAVTEVVGYLREMSPVWKALQRGERQYVIQ